MEPTTEPITITLTSEEARIYSDYEKGVNTVGYEDSRSVYRKILSQIRAAQSPVPSYTRGQVLSELWEPEFIEELHDGEHFLKPKQEPCFAADKRTGKIISEILISKNPERIKQLSFAPTLELAEELSQVIQGKRRPTQQDIDEKVPFWIYFPKGQTPIYEWDGCRIQTVKEDYIYFFTEAQCTTFIHTREAEQAKKEPQMFRFNGGIIEYGNSEIGFSSISTFRALNAILSFCREKGFKN